MPPFGSPRPWARRSSRSTRCSCTAGWTSGPPSPRRRRVSGPHPLGTGRTSQPFSVRRLRRGPPDEEGAPSREDAAVWGLGCSARSGTTWSSREQRRGSARIGGQARRSPNRMHAPRRGTRWGVEDREGNVRRTVRALEVAAITGRTFSSFAAEWAVRPNGPRRLRTARTRRWPEGGGRVQAMSRRGAGEVEEIVRGGASAVSPPPRPSLAAPPALALELRLRTPSADRKRTRFLARGDGGFRRDHRIRWFDGGSGGASEANAEMALHLEGRGEVRSGIQGPARLRMTSISSRNDRWIATSPGSAPSVRVGGRLDPRHARADGLPSWTTGTRTKPSPRWGNGIRCVAVFLRAREETGPSFAWATRAVRGG